MRSKESLFSRFMNARFGMSVTVLTILVGIRIINAVFNFLINR